MNTDNKVLNETNPVYNTAKMTLSILGHAGVEEAIMYAEKLGMSDIRERFDVKSDNNSDLPQAVIQETRYEFLNRVVREIGCRNVIDIACGFSPRGYKLANEGYNYMGVDLEASVEALTELTSKFEVKGKLSYRVCDVTDPDKFASLVDEFDGPVTIICEGLMMYLKPYEIEALCDGLRRALGKHGGYFVTPDFCFGDIYIGIHVGLLGEEEGMKALMAMAEKTQEKSDSKWDKSIYGRGGSALAMDYFRKRDMDIELIPYYKETQPCRVYNLMDPETERKMRMIMKSFISWKISAAAEEEIRNIPSNEYETTYRCEGDCLILTVSGRIDSVTSADMLDVYERASGKFKYNRVLLDMKDLDYISSAGLRVLLHIKKADSRLMATNITPYVSDVLETTGFMSMLEVI